MGVRVFRYASPSSFLRVLTVPVMSGCVSSQETMTTLFARLQYGGQCVPIDAADTEDREIFR